MRLKVSLLIPLSIVLGLAAVQSGRGWLDRQVDKRVNAMKTNKQIKKVEFATLVVAAQPLRFGLQVTAKSLKEIPWPSSALPKGSYSKIADLFKEQPRRVALDGMEINEPVLASKITGPGQKANLAGILEAGMKAITVRVDDVVGVAGFVLPGDRVDIILTRKIDKGPAFADNILQNIKVLAIDQKADDKLDKPSIARAVTLAVSTDQAQRLTVAQRVGTLTMVLRPVGESNIAATKRVSSNQLAGAQPVFAKPQKSLEAKPVRAPKPTTFKVNVIRSTERKQYSVPAYRR